MSKTIELKEIGWPTDYIRKEADMNHVADLRDVAASTDKPYPFDAPVMVRKLDKPALYAMTMTGKPGTCEYELVKGLHRCLAIQLNKGKTVLADVATFSVQQVVDGDALFSQYDAHGVLKLSVQERATFIKTLRSAPYKWSVEQVAERMRISTASVSRIARNLQGTKGQKGGGRKGGGKGKGKGKGATATATFVPSEWYAILGEIVAAYGIEDQGKAILGMVGTVDPGIIANALAMIAELDKARG